MFKKIFPKRFLLLPFVGGAVYMSFYQMDFSVLCMFGTWKYFYDYLAN